jgi:tetratricopeptide (TPR) repeat protein
VSRRAELRSSDTRYFLRFAGTAGLLVSGTLVLVLYVLPQRYVLSSGFREGSLNFPTPSTPFEPLDPRFVAALPPPQANGIVRGPAELFWERVLPLLDAERWQDAIPEFAFYLGDYPGDLGVRREYAITLSRAGHGEQAIRILELLLENGEDSELRLLLARTLRDEDRVLEADEHYSLLLGVTPDDEVLTLERARALAWVEEYDGAKAVVIDGLTYNPRSVPLLVELARLHFYTNDLEAAAGVLSGLTEAELSSADAITLRDDVRTALTPPPDPDVEPLPPPTTIELAIVAREDGDFESASSLFLEALDEHPDDVLAWQAYADFLQYELEDFEGALRALGEVERLESDGDPGLQYRMAQLEVWTERPGPARRRLEALLLLLDDESVTSREARVVGDRENSGGDRSADAASTDVPPVDPVTRADVHALLGDLHRWAAERLPAVDRYEMALAEDPEHGRALEGLAILRAEVDRMMIEAEQPHLGGISRSLGDTDDFRRLDLGGEWVGLHEDWLWGTRAGARWLEGIGVDGSIGDEQGVFLDLEGARWWRWGTVRTAVRFGVQSVRSDEVDASAGAAVRVLGDGGQRTDVAFDHEPAYVLTNTLQSAQADVRQDRFTGGHSQPLGESWHLALNGEVASLDPRGVAGGSRNLRVGGGLSLGRTLSTTVTLGITARGLGYADATPTVSGFPLYWDPKLNVSVGPYVQYDRPLGTWWELHARANPGFAYLDERRASGPQSVPDLSASVGVSRDGARYRTAIDFTYGQGRFTGYRSMALNLAFSARGWLGRGGRGGGE